MILTNAEVDAILHAHFQSASPPPEGNPVERLNWYRGLIRRAAVYTRPLGPDRYVQCSNCGNWKKMQEGNHHPWCACGSDLFRWETELDHDPDAPYAEDRK